MKQLDLNLLPVLLTMFEERSVSKAARKLGIRQSTLSCSLAKLRESLDDQLFIRAAGAMQPTQRTTSIVDSVREILDTVRRDIIECPSFDPSRLNGPITIALSDVGEMVFLPKLLDSIRACAPRAWVRSVSPIPSQLEEGLASGEIDLAIGYFPDLKHSNVFQQRLFDHHFLCLVREDHPIATSPLSLDQFLELDHVVVQASGRSQEIFEELLKRHHIRRKVVLTTPHFLSVPALIAASDLVVTVPHALGIAFGQSRFGLKALIPPFGDTRIEIKQFWHRNHNKAPRLLWLRQTVAKLFNDSTDEWVADRNGDCAWPRTQNLPAK